MRLYRIRHLPSLARTPLHSHAAKDQPRHLLPAQIDQCCVSFFRQHCKTAAIEQPILGDVLHLAGMEPLVIKGPASATSSTGTGRFQSLMNMLHKNPSFRPRQDNISIPAVSKNVNKADHHSSSRKRKGEKEIKERELTREEKIETLKIFAGMTEEQKSIFALGVAVGEYKTKFGQQAEETATQPA